MEDQADMTIKKLLRLAGTIIFSVPSLFAQGPLTPPGAPAVTMKTLGQLESRTPIASAPYAITTSGSYYLTTNLSSTGHGIIVQADHVTVDLMGFSVTGDGSGSDYGVFLDGDATRPVRNVRVHNGAIEGFYNGIRLEFARQNTLDDLRIAKCMSTGLILVGTGGSLCSGNKIVSCAISENTGYGIYLAGGGGAVDGNVIEECSIGENGNTGITLYGSSGSCAGNRIQNCLIRENSGSGITLTSSSNTVIQACSICKQLGTGIDVNTASSHNGIFDCLVAKNGGNGIVCSANQGNHIEGNFVSENDSTGYGILTQSSQKSLIVKNICIGHTNNYTIAATDTYGPIVTNTGALPTTGVAAHPWANFSRP